MATNMFKKYTEGHTREWVVPVGTQSGALVLQAVSGRVGVTLTARGDAVRTRTLADGSILTNISTSGVGNKPTTAVVATDGSWLFPVATVVNGDSTAGAGTPAGTQVFRVTATGALSLSNVAATLVGTIDDGFIIAGVAPVLIGAFA